MALSKEDKLKIIKRAAGMIQGKQLFARKNAAKKALALLNQVNISADEARTELEQQNLSDEAADFHNALNEAQAEGNDQPARRAMERSPIREASTEPAGPVSLDPAKEPVPGGEAVEPRYEGPYLNPRNTTPKNDADAEDPYADSLPEDASDGDIRDWANRPDTGVTNGEEEVEEAPPADGGNSQRPKKPGATDAAKKVAKDKVEKEVKKKVGAAILKFLAAYWPWVLLVVVILIGIVFLVVFLMEKNKSGKSEQIPVNYVEDGDIIMAFAKKGGISDIGSEVTLDTIKSLKDNVVNLKSTITDPPTLQMIDDLILDADNLVGADNVTVKEFVVNLLAVMQAVADLQAPPMAAPSSTILPATTATYNEEIHFGTPLRSELPTAESPGHGTYIQFGKGTADAVDIYMDTDSVVSAPFTGQIVDISDDGTGHKKIVIQSGDYELLIAFLDIESALAVGQNVNKGAKLGTTGTIEDFNLIHLELTYCGKAITNVGADRIMADREGKAIGEYLWERFKKILNIQ